MSSTKDLRAFEDGFLYLFTSLTAGSSHIITATSRLETILKANKIPFQAIDMATDEQARRLWQRRAQKKKLPGLVKDGYVIGDLEEVEEWNEFGELKENIGEVRIASSSNGAASGGRAGVNIRPVESPVSPRPSEDRADVTHPNASETASALTDSRSRIALPGAAEIAERNKAKSQSPPLAKSPPAIKSVASPTVEKKPNAVVDKELSAETVNDSSTTATATADKEGIGNAAKETTTTTEDNDNALKAEQPAKPSPPKESKSTPISGGQAETPASPPAAPVSEPSVGAAGETAPKTHQGSDVQTAPSEEIKTIEGENALQEDPAEDAAVEKTRSGVESVTFDDEPEKT